MKRVITYGTFDLLHYYLKEWCKKNGFKVISCEGDGDDSGFEPDSVRRWIKYET